MLQKLYNWILFVILILVFAMALHLVLFRVEVKAGDDEKKYLQTSPIDNRKQVIHSGTDAKSEGYLQKSYIDPRKTIQYDKNGDAKGCWQKSYIDPRKTVFIEKE